MAGEAVVRFMEIARDHRPGEVFSALDPPRGGGFLRPPSLPDGVMVAQVTLTHLVMVRIHVGQPIWTKREIGAIWVKGGLNSLILGL